MLAESSTIRTRLGIVALFDEPALVLADAEARRGDRLAEDRALGSRHEGEPHVARQGASPGGAQDLESGRVHLDHRAPAQRQLFTTLQCREEQRLELRGPRDRQFCRQLQGHSIPRRTSSPKSIHAPCQVRQNSSTLSPRPPLVWSRSTRVASPACSSTRWWISRSASIV